jgi:PPOX class probable F420-dependent enzyme
MASQGNPIIEAHGDLGDEEGRVTVSFQGWAREFLQRAITFATLATLEVDGAPLQAVIWYALREDSILVNSAVGRRWPTNLLRDPRFSFVVESGYEWVGVRGVAEALSDPDQAQEDIAAMARRYHGRSPRSRAPHPRAFR